MRINQFSFWFLLSLFLEGCGSVPDASSLTIEQMIINIAKAMPPILQLLTAAAYIMGFIFIFKGIYRLKEYGEMRTAMSSQTNLWGGIITLFIGTMLIYFVSSYQIGLQTLFNSPSPLAYTDTTSASGQLVSAVVLIMQVIGIIAFIRGLLLLNSSGGHSAQPGSIGKGLTFIIGGILAINAYGTWVMLVNTVTGV